MSESKINDFLKHKGEYSHTRLISIIGSFVIFGAFIYYPDNNGLQNLMAIIISASLINATASKFSKNETVRTPEFNRSDEIIMLKEMVLIICQILNIQKI